MEWVKTTAKTLPEAIDLALDNLGVDESEAEINVLEEPRSGLFGRTRGIARVEARVKPKQSRPKVERNRNRNRRSDGDSNRNRNRTSPKKADTRGDKAARQDNSQKRSGQNQKKKPSDSDQAASLTTAERSEVDTEQEASQQAGSRSNGGSTGTGQGGGKRGRSRNRRRSGGGGEGRPQGQSTKNADGEGSSDKADNRSKSSSGSTKDREAVVPSQDASVEEVSAHLEEFLNGLTEAFGYDTDVVLETSESDESVVGRIEERIGLLVGPKGRTLEAVQELARISCQRTVPSNVRIKVDVGGYRAQRADALATFARSAADRAVADGVEVGLEPMSAADRKAVHDALNGDDRVTTRSIGVDPRRRILVVPNEVDDTTNDGSAEGEPDESLAHEES